MKEEVSLERLNRQLAMSSRMLDDCAGLIRDLELNPKENIRRIGEALVLIFDVQDQIYEQRPDLTPEHLKKEWNRPRSETEAAEDELASLRGEAEAHKLYLEWIERRISELEKTTK
jgi:hypothetical protein